MQDQGDRPGSLPFHEVLTRWGPEYLKIYDCNMPLRQREVLERILDCRTASMGGSLYTCPRCGDSHYAYHSCNDRHCPRCGTSEADQWLERQKERLLLPLPYFLVTFTVPEALRTWIRSNPKEGYDLLFSLSARAMQDLAGNPKRLGGSLGMLGVLHTWSRTLIYHPHIHYLVPGGALSLDQRQWKPSSKKFLLPVKVLGQHFRSLFKAALKEHHPQAMGELPTKVWKQSWVVHCQPVGSGVKALEYLSRYVFKTATGDRTLHPSSDGKLLWPYRDSGSGKQCRLKLKPLELIRRFLQHILPARYTRVRCYGWFHPAARIRLNRVRALLKEKPVLTPQEQETWLGSEQSQTNPIDAPETDPESVQNPEHCPVCRRCRVPMVFVESWHSGQPRPQPGHPP